ncbi:hypothetical protein BGX29_000618 [Mortierella sp. GBA35]|nr:hypothetical protein BGX29_000618 [Mortierella sp. GBA35]
MNLEWFSRATNWSKFSATAALGVLHQGHISPYFERGPLFTLGLIHTNHGDEILDYLYGVLKDTQIEVQQHGAFLGLVAVGMATDDDDIYEELKYALFCNSIIAGEAADLPMSVVMLDTALEKALDGAQDIYHERSSAVSPSLS